jgi:threonine/homoserine/homoserine lactone efflux protein
MNEHLLAFLGAAAVLIMTPGPDTALTVRNALFGGRSAGMATALGVALGQAVWATAAALGVAALVRASQPALLALRLVGGGYLLYLGLRALRAATSAQPVSLAQPRPSAGGGFGQGLLSNLANPKMPVFFIGLLPQFAAQPLEVCALGMLFAAMTLLWLCGYACGVARLGAFLSRRKVRRVIDAASGGLLVALGLRLASEAPRRF